MLDTLERAEAKMLGVVMTDQDQRSSTSRNATIVGEMAAAPEPAEQVRRSGRGAG